MSSRLLRKLQGANESVQSCDTSNISEDVQSTDEEDIPPVKTQLDNCNRYNLLNSHSLESSSSENEEQQPNVITVSERRDVTKKKKKKKKRPIQQTQLRSEEEQVVWPVTPVKVNSTSTIGTVYDEDNEKKPCYEIDKMQMLITQHKHLNARNEMKRIFGSKIVQNERRRRHLRQFGNRNHSMRPSWIIDMRENWPPFRRNGISMQWLGSHEGTLYFTYEHNESYRQVQNTFLLAVESHSPQYVIDLLHEHPYHVDALIQTADLCQIGEERSLAVEFIERAVYCLESVFHPMFNLTQGNCRLNYRRQENRALFITIFKHLINVGSRACARTSLELCKMLLAFSPDDDPMATVLIIDYYAIKSKEYKWLIDFANSWETTKNLSQLPNFTFSLSMAQFYLRHSDDEPVEADQLLQNALIMFPPIMPLLLEKCSIAIDQRVRDHQFYSAELDRNRYSDGLMKLINLYVNRCYHLWKDPDLLPWLQKNVHQILDRVDSGDPFIEECQAQVRKRYTASLPRNVARHLILSNISNNIATVTDDYSFDPLPPLDTVNIYTKPTVEHSSNNHPNSTLTLFVHSLLPTFNNEHQHVQREPENGAAAIDATRLFHVPSLTQSVGNLVGAIRQLFINDAADGTDSGDSDENVR